MCYALRAKCYMCCTRHTLCNTIKCIQSRDDMVNETRTSCLDAQFVGAFDSGDKVYFFFREMAIEQINCGKVIKAKTIFH